MLKDRVCHPGQRTPTATRGSERRTRAIVFAGPIGASKERSLAYPEEALSAGNVLLTGNGGDTINAYQARPEGNGPFPGVVVIHHLPGWDSSTKEITRTFAAHGYNAICANLYSREGLD